jgi:hypothetical protein
MKIKQELLESGFIVRVRTEDEMLDVVNCFNINPSPYNFDKYGDETCLDCYELDVLYASEEWYRDNHADGDKIYNYDDIWIKESIKPNERAINAKQSIFSLILDKQLSSGKRFDNFIDDLPVDNEILVDFIFEDGILLLQEVFDILGYLNCEINIEEVK